MSRVVKPLACLVLLLAAAYLARSYLLGLVQPPPPPTPPSRGAKSTDLDALRGASAFDAPMLFRQAMDRAPTPEARAELERLFAVRAADATRALDASVGPLRESHRYAEAVQAALRYATAWKGTEVGTRADTVVAELRAEEEEQVARRADEAMALLGEGRFDGAREALATGWQLEPPYAEALRERAEAIERLIRVRQYEASRVPGLGPAVAKPPPGPPGTPPAPPPLPGAPHVDVKRLAEARELLATARKALNEGRYEPAAKAAADVIGFFGDLRYVARRKGAITALGLLARHGTSGLTGLFRATEVKRDGMRVRLRYTFETEEEMLDWEELPLVPHPGGGKFQRVADGVRGEGVMSFLLRAFFENDVTIRCNARPRYLKSHGLVLSQDGTEQRFLLWMVANTFFVEGENYVKERPGHSILMFGKGVNNDVAVDSPEMGFIFRGPSITSPQLVAGEEELLAFQAKGDEMSGEVLFKGDRGGRSGSTLGDDGRGIERLRPGLIVLDNTVTFRDVRIEGRLKKDFEHARVSALLDEIAVLDEQ
jgi:hypothetical protein